MEIKAGTIQVNERFIPTITVDDDIRKFKSASGEPNHARFITEAEALSYAQNVTEELRQVVLHTLQEAGFIT